VVMSHPSDGSTAEDVLPGSTSEENPASAVLTTLSPFGPGTNPSAQVRTPAEEHRQAEEGHQ
jgi:hypothetical protein